MEPRLRKIRNIVCITVVAILCLACILLDGFNGDPRIIKTPITGEITEIGKDWIRVLPEGREDGEEYLIVILNYTNFFDANGKKIKFKHLSVGQKVDLLVEGFIAEDNSTRCHELTIIE